MAHWKNPFYCNNFVDANILNAVADGENEAVNDIIKLARNGDISFLLPYSVQDEIENPSTPPHVKKAAAEFVFSVPVTLTHEEQRRYRELVSEAKGDAKAKNRPPRHRWTRFSSRPQTVRGGGAASCRN